MVLLTQNGSAFNVECHISLYPPLGVLCALLTRNPLVISLDHYFILSSFGWNRLCLGTFLTYYPRFLRVTLSKGMHKLFGYFLSLLFWSLWYKRIRRVERHGDAYGSFEGFLCLLLFNALYWCKCSQLTPI